MDNCILSVQHFFQGHSGTVTSLSFHSFKKQLVSGSTDKTLMIWDFQKTPRNYSFSGHKDAILDVCFSPLGNLVASGSSDQTVRLWAPSICGTVEGFQAHVSAVRSVDFSPDGQTLLTASDDKQVKLWAVPQKKLLSNLHGHTNCVRCARFSPDGRLVASCSDDRTINIIDHVSHECVYTIKLLKGYANFVNFHPNGTCIAAAQNSGGVNVYDIRMKKLLQHYARHKAPVNKLAFHPSGSYLVTASDDSTIKIFDLPEEKSMYKLESHEGPVTSIAFSRDGEFFSSGGVDREVRNRHKSSVQDPTAPSTSKRKLRIELKQRTRKNQEIVKNKLTNLQKHTKNMSQHLKVLQRQLSRKDMMKILNISDVLKSTNQLVNSFTPMIKYINETFEENITTWRSSVIADTSEDDEVKMTSAESCRQEGKEVAKKEGRKEVEKKEGRKEVEKKEERKEVEKKEERKECHKLFEKAESTEVGDKLVLDFDPESKEELVSVHPEIVKKLKPHQREGIKFIWKTVFESLKEHNNERSGCILSHCTGSGKTLQVVALVHTLLTNEEITVKRVLIVCPLSTVSNWVSELHTWPEETNTHIDVYELTYCKQNKQRSLVIKSWHENGGAMVIGYDLFRNLVNPGGKKIRKNIVESLLDPDLVVCDEGHPFKGKTVLSKAISKIRTSRRIILTGTPLQNNLIEYHSMVQFVKPNLLGTLKEFKNRFVNPIHHGQFENSTAHDVKVMQQQASVLKKN